MSYTNMTRLTNICKCVRDCVLFGCLINSSLSFSKTKISLFFIYLNLVKTFLLCFWGVFAYQKFG
ncbi:hypothetical protein [Moraxella lacunata]|uniref:hypothetical protein n=1 Tax=Moraxella lacunata TaxID=477 RepID=UPI003EE093F2